MVMRPSCLRLSFCRLSPSGGMADAGDSKSPGGNPVRVRLSPRALRYDTCNNGARSLKSRPVLLAGAPTSNVTAPSQHPFGNSSALPPTALSVALHVALAVVLLWPGARLFDSSGGELRAAEARPAMTWVMLPAVPAQRAATSTMPLKSDMPSLIMAQPLRTLLTMLPSSPLRAAVPVPLAAPVDIDDKVSGDSGTTTSCGTVREVVPMPAPATKAEAPPNDNREHDVQFWIRADGRVTRIAVSPPITDSDYRRRFMEAMSTFVFGPVSAPDGHPIDYIYSCVVYS